LEKPRLWVKLSFKGDREASLRLAKPVEVKKQTAALSSQLPAIVSVSNDFLEELPKEVRDLEDRSLFSNEDQTVDEIRWRIGHDEGILIRLSENEWAWETIKEKQDELEEPWRVKSFLWELHDAEYEQNVAPVPPIPDQPYGQIDLWNEDERLETFTWENPVEKKEENTAVWIEDEDEKLNVVVVKTEVLDKVTGALIEIGKKKVE
jgi:hypothetical protein